MQTAFSVSEDWETGLVGFFTVENSDAQVRENWSLTIETTFDIETIWGVDVIAQSGNRYTVAPESWNAQLAPGDIAKFGFVGHNATAYPHQVKVVPPTPPISSVPETVPAEIVNDVSEPLAVSSVAFELVHQWGKVFSADLSFTYNGTQPLTGWEIKFEAPFSIVDAWHGVLVGQSENQYTIRNTQWNRILLPGDTITIQVKGAGQFSEPPTNYYFNDTAITHVSDGPITIDLPAAPDAPSEPPVEIPAAPTPIDDGSDPVELPPTVEDPEVPTPPGPDAPPVSEPGTSEQPGENPIQPNPGGEQPPAAPEPPVEQPPAVSAPPVEQPPILEESVTSPPSETPIALEDSSSVYGKALQKSFLFYEAQRAGDLPDDNRIAWRGDSTLDDGADVGVDLSGGYYDAGDHVKFGFPMAGSLTLLSWGAIEYEEGYRRSGQYDELKDAIKWGTDYLLKAHISDGQATQALYGQVGDPNTDHQYWGPPEELAIHRPAYKVDPENPGSDLAAETAAALASASMVFRDSDPAYADELLANAKQLYAFADTYRGRYSDSIPQVQEYYNSWSGYDDELAWGAAWLYQATGEQHYLDKAQQNYPHLGIDWTHNWDDKSYGTGVLLAQITGEERYRTEVENWLDHWVSGGVSTTDGGLAWLDEWGSLRYSANTAFLAGIYGDTVNSAAGKYDQFSQSQIDYILGNNPAQQSYVAGIGDDFPEYIHHRGASGTYDINDTEPNQHVLYGALVGGPKLPNDFSYVDDRGDFLGNEVSLDFNAGFTGAVARLYEQEGGPLLSDAELTALSQTGLSEVV